MVLPAGKEIRIFGDGEGDVTVSLCGNRAQGVCSDGKWEAVLPPMTYGGPHEIRIELDGEAVTLENVYVGKVYIFAGQSNMQFKLHESSTSVDECEPTELLRLFSTGRLESGEFFFPQALNAKLSKTRSINAINLFFIFSSPQYMLFLILLYNFFLFVSTVLAILIKKIGEEKFFAILI